MQIKDVTQTDRLDRMRRDFVANVSHELRTPLTVLAGFLETLQEIELDRDERQRYLGMMSEQSQRMQIHRSGSADAVVHRVGAAAGK
jgi:two-component system phosphate regulon sensor histidine kinase PhoR